MLSNCLIRIRCSLINKNKLSNYFLSPHWLMATGQEIGEWVPVASGTIIWWWWWAFGERGSCSSWRWLLTTVSILVIAPESEKEEKYCWLFFRQWQQLHCLFFIISKMLRMLLWRLQHKSGSLNVYLWLLDWNFVYLHSLFC